MDGESEDGGIFAEDRGGAVAVVYVGVHDDRAIDFLAGLQGADGDGYIVNGAKPFAVAGIGVMEPAPQVTAEAVLERGFSGDDGAAGGQPEGADEFRRIRDFELHLFAGGECPGFEFVDPVGRMDAQDVGVGGGFRAEKVFNVGDGVVEEFVVNEAEFLRRKDVGAEMQVVVFVIDEFERKHGSHG